MAGKLFETEVRITGNSTDAIAAINAFNRSTGAMGRTSQDASRKAGSSFDRLRRTVRKDSRQMSTDLSVMSSATAGLSGSFRSLFHVALGVAGFHAMAQGVREVYTAAAQFQGLETGFSAVFDTFEAGGAQMQFVRDLADELGLNMRTLAKDYQDLAAAAKDTNLEGAQTAEIFTAVATAGRALNMSADDVHGSLRAIQQMISKGTVQAEELRGQLGERLPGALQLAADAMDVTTAELSKMMEQGQLVADDLLPRLADMLTERFGNAAIYAADTAIAQMERVKTGFFRLSAALGASGGLDLIARGAKLASTAMNDLAQDLETGVLADKFEIFTETSAQGWQNIADHAQLSAFDVKSVWVSTLDALSEFFRVAFQEITVWASSFPSNLEALMMVTVAFAGEMAERISGEVDKFFASLKNGLDLLGVLWNTAWLGLEIQTKKIFRAIVNDVVDGLRELVEPLANLAEPVSDSLAASMRGALAAMDRDANAAATGIAKLENELDKTLALLDPEAEGSLGKQLEAQYREIDRMTDAQIAAWHAMAAAYSVPAEDLMDSVREQIDAIDLLGNSLAAAEVQFNRLAYASDMGMTTILAAYDEAGKRVDFSKIDVNAPDFNPDNYTYKIDIVQPEKPGSGGYVPPTSTSAITAHTKEVERLRDAMLELEAIDDPFGAGAEKALRTYQKSMSKLVEGQEGYNEAKEMAMRLLEHELEQLDPMAKAWDEYTRSIQHNAQQMAEAMTGAFKSMEDSLAESLRKGKLDFSSFVNYVLDEIARMLAQNLMNDIVGGIAPALGMSVGGSSATSYMGSSLESSLFDVLPFDLIGNIFHTGGVPQVDGPQGSRAVSPEVFRNAPRYHTGTGARSQLAAYEEAAILRKDEGVFTRGQMSAMASIGTVKEAVKAAAGPNAQDNAIVFSPQYNIDARGATPDMERRIKNIAKRQSDESMAEFQKQIRRGGGAARLVGRRG